MVTCVEQSIADLVLMGVTPTYASTKYGYVVPVADDANDCKRVLKFAEKPTVERAEELLQQGAYWNGGVFAFRLGYMMDILSQYLSVDNFAELRGRYTELPKISFDYEVVEKAVSVAVVPFTGMWRDLGTWNALVEELPRSTIGNVILGDQATNSMVINELSIPLVCNGVDNIIVAASYDGILVCGKESSEHIKPYVEPIDSRPMLEQRRWGSYKVINNVTYADGTCSLTKELNLNPGCHISYQVHHHRDEIWTFVDGEGLLVIDEQTIHVTRGDVYSIKKGQYHAVKAITPLQIIEVQVGNPLIEEDIERFDFDWNIFNVNP
jgi:mannose-1-phosphate guanylyltransferase